MPPVLPGNMLDSGRHYCYVITKQQLLPPPESKGTGQGNAEPLPATPNLPDIAPLLGKKPHHEPFRMFNLKSNAPHDANDRPKHYCPTMDDSCGQEAPAAVGDPGSPEEKHRAKIRKRLAVGLGTMIFAAALAILWITSRSDVHHRHTAKAKYPYWYSKTDLTGVVDANLFGNLKALFEGKTRDDVDEWLEQHKAPGDAQGVSGFSLVAYKSEGILTMVLTFKNKYREDVVETHNLSLNSKGEFEVCR